jgi:hypothetical protein
MSEPHSIEVRSYRNVFALERRIYRVDRIRLNPSGVPVRGVLYGTALTASVFALAQLPLTGWLLAPLPWYLRDVGLPLGAAALLTLIRVEGRAFHVGAFALARHAACQRRLKGLRGCGSLGPGHRWRAPELLVLPDGSDACLRRLRFTGPGAALIAVPHVCTRHGSPKAHGGSCLRVRRLPSRQPLRSRRVLVLARAVRMDIRRA